MIRVLDMTFEQLKAAVAAEGVPAYRADQIADWVYRKGVARPEKMTNLPAAIQSRLEVLTTRVARRADSTDGTVKLLLELADHETIECVMIPAPRRNTACVSTQVGCAMRCAFCASGLRGFRRNLSAGEILQQILHLQEQTGERITHVVYMGMGEPLANYDATVASIKALIDPKRFGISARHVSVSTVGLPAQIRRLAQENLPITLAISLHAPNDPIRRQIIPMAAQHPIEKVIAAAQEFFQSRKREVTLEYILIDGVNDSAICAEGLARIAHQLRCNVNLIQYNPVATLPLAAPSQTKLAAFAAKLEKRGVNVNIRRSRGADADAACGQLRLRELNNNQT